jgi:hypothetical protein
VKLSSSLLLLLVPIVLFIGILSLPRNVLEKASFYSKPLIVNTIWLAKEIKEVSKDKNGNKVYELILDQGERVNLKRYKDEGLFSFQTVESEEGSFYVLTNRVAVDNEVKKIMNAINNKFSDSNSIKEMKAKLTTPGGYKQDISVEFDYVNHPLYAFLAFICLSMYIPIIRPIIKKFKKKSR